MPLAESEGFSRPAAVEPNLAKAHFELRVTKCPEFLDSWRGLKRPRFIKVPAKLSPRAADEMTLNADRAGGPRNEHRACLARLSRPFPRARRARAGRRSLVPPRCKYRIRADRPDHPRTAQKKAPAVSTEAFSLWRFLLKPPSPHHPRHEEDERGNRDESDGRISIHGAVANGLMRSRPIGRATRPACPQRAARLCAP
jgi:hypothetical protein